MTARKGATDLFILMLAMRQKAMLGGAQPRVFQLTVPWISSSSFSASCSLYKFLPDPSPVPPSAVVTEYQVFIMSVSPSIFLPTESCSSNSTDSVHSVSTIKTHRTMYFQISMVMITLLLVVLNYWFCLELFLYCILLDLILIVVLSFSWPCSDISLHMP